VTKPSRGASVSHLVLNVRDIEDSHRFYTEVMGFEQCGTFENERLPDVDMRFYRGSAAHHHDLALVGLRDPSAVPGPEPFALFANRPGINHIAISYPDRDAWLGQLAHLQECGVTFHVRGNHGMTHSAYISDPDGHGIEVLYDLPPDVWEGDVNAALNYFEPLPNEGPGALEDTTEYHRFTPA
jgi:catechol 2,3-dioxygenase